MDLVPIPQKMRMISRLQSPHLLKNFNEHLQIAMRSCSDII